jgi:hypothetical protein
MCILFVVEIESWWCGAAGTRCLTWLKDLRRVVALFVAMVALIALLVGLVEVTASVACA